MSERQEMSVYLRSLSATIAMVLSASSQAQTPSPAETAFKLSYCGELSRQLSELSTDRALKEMRAGAALRYVLPMLELVPDDVERKAITESAAKVIVEKSRALRDSQHLLAEAYESARVSFVECNQIRSRLDAARPAEAPASAPR